MKTKLSKSRAACAAQHFGIWCADHQWHRETVAAVKSGLLKAQVPDSDWETPLTYDVVDGVAVIPVNDMLTKGRSSFGGTSMLELAYVLRQADRDPAVQSVLLEIDSPGGTYIGIEIVTVALSRMTKPTMAKISDWAMSGGLWVAVFCDEIIANKNARVGSIGAFTLLVDSSKADEKEGINCILVTSGELKGAGEDGRISKALVEDTQNRIDLIATQFISVVAENRGLSIESVKAIADGRTFTANEALRLGLIDRVIDEVDAETFLLQEQTMDKKDFMAYASQHPDDLKDAAKDLVKQESEAAVTAAKPKPATIAELETAFPGDPAFVIAQFKTGATMTDAKIAHAETLKVALEKAQAEVSTLKADLAKTNPALAGVKAPVQTDPGTNPTDPTPGQPAAVSETRKRELLAKAGIHKK